MALKIVGSSPIIHPRKDTRLDTISSLVFLFYVGMMPGMGYCSNFFRYIEFCGGIVQCWIGNSGLESERAIVHGIGIVQAIILTKRVNSED